MKNDPILKDIVSFFEEILLKKGNGKYYYAVFKNSWLKEIGLDKNSAEEAICSRTTKKLQEVLVEKYRDRIKSKPP